MSTTTIKCFVTLSSASAVVTLTPGNAGNAGVSLAAPNIIEDMMLVVESPFNAVRFVKGSLGTASLELQEAWNGATVSDAEVRISTSGAAVANLTSAVRDLITSPPSASAAEIEIIPTGNLQSTSLQGALAELDAEKQAVSAKDAAGGYVGITQDFKTRLSNLLGTVASYFVTNATAARTYTFPDKDITVAGVSDITKAAVGLSNVSNTADADKPVSTATANALTAVANAIDGKVATSAVGSANGVASLGADGKVPSAQLPAASGVSSSDDVPEGVNHLYFAVARVRSTVLAGLDLASGAAVEATDSVLVALGKLQKQLTDVANAKDASGGYAGLTAFKINFKNAANTFTSFLTNANTAARSYTFPDYDATMATVGGIETLTSKTLTTPVITGTKETRVAMAASNIDCSAGNVFTKTITGATTLTVSNVPPVGTSYSFCLVLTNGGSAVVTQFAGVKVAGGAAISLTTAGRDRLFYMTEDGGATWDLSVAKGFA